MIKSSYNLQHPNAGLPGSTTEIPDIFDVLEGGEDEGTVRFLLGFNGEDASVSLLGVH